MDIAMEESTEIIEDLNINTEDNIQSNLKKKIGRPNKFITEDSQFKLTPVNENQKSSNKRGRPRKIRKVSESAEPIEITNNRRSQRKSLTNKKYSDYIDIEDDKPSTSKTRNVDILDDIDDKPLARRRGRKKKVVEDEETEPVLNKPVDDSVDDIQSILDDNIICGACELEIPRMIYKTHQINKHNGLSWIKDEEEPIDYRDSSMQNQAKLTKLVTDAFIRKKGPFNKYSRRGSKRKQMNIDMSFKCEKCGNKSGSAAGYVSHFTFCQISIEEANLRKYLCPICDRLILPASRYYHEQTHANPKKIVKVVEEPIIKTGKRKAALMAEKYVKHFMDTSLNNDRDLVEIEEDKNWSDDIKRTGIAKCKYPNCEFTAESVDIIKQHCNQDCTFKKLAFDCKYCGLILKTNEEYLNHIEIDHKGTETEDTEEQFNPDKEIEEPEPPRVLIEKRRSEVVKISTYSTYNAYLLPYMKAYHGSRNKLPYTPATIFTIETQKLRDYKTILFPLLTEYKPFKIRNDNIEENKKSISFCCINKLIPNVDQDFINKQNWQSLPIYTGIIENGMPCLFAGGPITTLSWCPTPFSLNNEQLLAVCCHRDMDTVEPVLDVISSAGIIQIWSFGDLNNSTKDVNNPKFLMGLCHNWGTIRDLQWCPSGCWAPQRHLYGLLSIACSDGSIRLLPIPKSSEYNLQFLDAQASLILISSLSVPRKSPCISLSWQYSGDHSVIAGGFSNGVVALWKISNQSKLLKCRTDQGDEMLLPYKQFHAHTGIVSSIEICPFTTEVKYLCTGSITERSLLYWDLDRDISLGGYTKLSPKRYKTTSLTWPSNWPAVIASFEEQNVGTSIVPPTNFYKNHLILPQNSCVSCVDKSDFYNSIAQSTVPGELTVNFMPQCLFSFDGEKHSKDRRALITKTCITAQALNSSSNSKDYKDFGLIFCNYKLNTVGYNDTDATYGQLTETMDLIDSGKYPLQAINKISWNPNAQSCGWIAIGHQCGIVRLVHVKSKDVVDTIIRSIPK